MGWGSRCGFDRMIAVVRRKDVQEESADCNGGGCFIEHQNESLMR